MSHQIGYNFRSFEYFSLQFKSTGEMLRKIVSWNFKACLVIASIYCCRVYLHVVVCNQKKINAFLSHQRYK